MLILVEELRLEGILADYKDDLNDQSGICGDVAARRFKNSMRLLA